MDREIRDSFPAARKYTYLNTASIGPLPNVTVEAVGKQLEDVARNGSTNLYDWLERKEKVRSLVADMLGARADDIAFTRNTSDGLCAVAAGLDWVAGDNIVTIDGEFPANYYPWRVARDERGVELRLCPQRNGSIDTEELCSMIDARTRLVAVSAVQYGTGARVDLEEIACRAHRHDALFAVDIIQAFGAIPIDVTALNIDIAAGASYKWLCAPEGVGIFFLSGRARERVKPLSRGWSGVSERWNFSDVEQTFIDDTRSWETGMGGTALLCGLEASMKFLLGIGVERIAGYLGDLTDFLREVVPRSRYRIVSDCGVMRSHIVSLLPTNGLSSAEITRRLAQHEIVVSARGPLVRVAPHVFNNFDDIECLTASLP